MGLRGTIAVTIGALAVVAAAARMIPSVALAGWYALWESE